ncbi:hypothetical protein [Cutibacterium avidum]|uniref:hypothetical protein n=1 Tax=Cutibacterium avidum TaxID=33010 RepID=UPI000390C754|nr:hypothetical protein [Cutibacterium avidum]ERS37960.1 hypothetical protein HMPREF1271_00992 [Propionibacterium sp. KPL1838]ERS69190.1 hypothetical protein HMPREF1279_00290 [Propionibacterium sp. KPL1852]MBS6261200.1 hypothetical protein [Propionibacterium sp.]ERF58743.1 hypothetical protein H639_03077 [Cutibacterium avidum TM16]MBS6331892.1 hypothetical protein [Propionibacterium sp.]
MKNPKVYLTSLLITIVGTLALAVGTILVLMFSVHEESAYRTGLFGSVYFKSAPNAQGNVDATMGVASLPRLGIIAAVIFAFTLLVSFIYLRLKAYRESLIQ